MGARRKPGPTCGIERVRRQLDESGREVVDMLVSDRSQHGWSDQQVADGIGELLRQIGADDQVQPHRQTVGEHRRGKCACDPEGDHV